MQKRHSAERELGPCNIEDQTDTGESQDIHFVSPR